MCGFRGLFPKHKFNESTRRWLGTCMLGVKEAWDFVSKGSPSFVTTSICRSKAKKLRGEWGIGFNGTS